MTDGSLPLGIIPARAGSSRFPRKVIAPISNKPMIQYVWESARACSSLGSVLVATDDGAVAEVARNFGAQTLLTPESLPSGTDRVAFAARGLQAPIVINLQADEPLLTSEAIDSLVACLQSHPRADIATLAVARRSVEELSDPNVVKVVVTRDFEAMYFSRKPLASGPNGFFLKHIGIYAYRREALFRFCDLPVSPLEALEKLEQLRALENGMKIQVVPTECDTIAVDVPQDIEKVEARLLAGRIQGN